MSRKKMQRELFDAQKVREYEESLARNRLDQACSNASAGPPGRGILPFILDPVCEADQVTGRAGLSLVVEAFRGYRGDKLVGEQLKLKQRRRGFTEKEMVEAFLLLLSSGGEHLEDFVVLGDDEGLCRLLGRELPSPDAAREFLVRFHDESLLLKARQEAEAAKEKSYVPEENAALKGMGRILAELAGRIAAPSLSTCATLDHDATVIDSDKRTATFHYKGGTGYQPSVVVWAEQDLLVADEFRDGNVPAGKDNLRLLQRAVEALPEWVTEVRFRADSACYEEKVLKWLAGTTRKDGRPIGFTISADMTPELAAVCKNVLEPGAPGGAGEPRWALLDDTREHETVQCAEVEFTPGVWPRDAWPLRYLVIRFTKRQDQLFPSGERFKFLAIVSNRSEPVEELIRWHWQKAGTIEHVHEEIKNGLGGGSLPCAEFGANAAWFRLNLLTYNILTAIKRQTLPPEEHRAKAKRLRFLVFDLAARLTSHARYLHARIKQSAVDRIRLLLARGFFLAMRRTPAFSPRS
jgi:hypothetical protein